MRAIALAGVALLLLVSSVAGYYFLEPLAGNAAVWDVLFDTATISIILWVQIAFLFVKMLFVNADGVLEFSYHLPLTNRERAMAFMIYEASMTAAIVAAGSVSFTASAFLLLGPEAVPHVFVSITFPVVVTYLVLSVVYLLLNRLFAALKLRAIANILVTLTLFGLVVAYSAHMTSLTSAVGQAYLDEVDSFTWVTSFAWLSRQYGSWAALAAAAFLIVALALLALRLTPNQHVRHSRYLNVPVGRWLRRLFGPYDWCLLRHSQTMVAASVTLVLFLYLTINPVINPIWSLCVLSLGGLYQFTATQPLRTLVGGGSSPWRIYGLLLRAQLTLLTLFAVPALLILAIVKPEAVLESPLAFLGCVAGGLLTTCIGIVFPAEKDNPFSVFIGLSVTAVVLAMVALGLGLLQLPPTAVAGCLAGASVLLVWYSVQGISTSESRRKNAKGTVGSELRRRGGDPDLGDSGHDAALPHVLDR